MRPLLFVLLAISSRASFGADTVVVLPFENASKAANLEWIGESIAENLREALASKGVLALSREDRLEALRRLSIRPGATLTRASMVKVGGLLDAGQLIHGTYEFVPYSEAASKGLLKISARLIELKRMRQGPDFRTEGPLEDLATLQTRLGWQALQVFAPKTAPSEEEFRKARPPVRLDALENYVRGLLAATPDQKHRFFTQAARLDTRFSQPCFELGRINWQKKEYATAAGWLERVTPADAHYFEARFFLGLCRYYMADFAAAQTAFRLVAASVPLNEVWNNLGAAEARGKVPSAVQSFYKALEGDNADPDYHFNVGYALWKKGEFATAIQSFRAVLERNPNDAEAATFLARCEKQEGPRPGEPKSDGRERLKLQFEDSAYRQLQAELESKR